MATALKFLRGNQANLASVPEVDGQVLFVMDNGTLHIDTPTGRVKMYNSVITDVATLKSQIANLLPGEDEGDIGAIAEQIAAAVATEKSRAEAAEKALEDKIGTASTEEDVATGLIADIEKNAADIKAIQEALGGTGEEGEDASLTEKVAANTLAIEKLNGEATEEGSVKKTVADAIAAVVADAPEDLDTLKEIADYIASDKTGATEINNKIADLEATVGKAAVPGDGEDEGTPATGLVKDVADNTAAIAAETTRAKAAEEANATAIATLNGADTVEGSVKKAIKDALAGDNGLVWGDFADAI